MMPRSGDNLIIPRRIITAAVGVLATLTVVLALGAPASAREVDSTETGIDFETFSAPVATAATDSAGYPQVGPQQSWCGGDGWPVDGPAHDGTYFTPGFQMYAEGHNGFQSGSVWEKISLHHLCLWWGEHLSSGHEAISLAAEWDPEGLAASMSATIADWTADDQSCNLNRIDNWSVIGADQKTIRVVWWGQICEAELLFVTGSELEVTGGVRNGGNYTYYSQTF